MDTVKEKMKTEPKWKKVEAGLYEADMQDGFTIQCARYDSDDHWHWGYKYWAYRVTWTGRTNGKSRFVDHTPNGEYEPTLKECKEMALRRYVHEKRMTTTPPELRINWHSAGGWKERG